MGGSYPPREQTDEALHHLVPTSTDEPAAHSASTKRPRFERESRLRDEGCYRIPDSRRNVSCISVAFTEHHQETHETGPIRVQIRTTRHRR